MRLFPSLLAVGEHGVGKSSQSLLLPRREGIASFLPSRVSDKAVSPPFLCESRAQIVQPNPPLAIGEDAAPFFCNKAGFNSSSLSFRRLNFPVFLFPSLFLSSDDLAALAPSLYVNHRRFCDRFFPPPSSATQQHIKQRLTFPFRLRQIELFIIGGPFPFRFEICLRFAFVMISEVLFLFRI